MAAKTARLDDRGIVAVSGSDAANFLQNLLTNNVSELTAGSAAFAGLLSPQGKILFDFLVTRDGDRFLLDIAREKAAELIKRLTLYKLRAAVTLADLSASHDVRAHWGDDLAMGIADPRLAALGHRSIVPAGEATSGQSSSLDYHAHRIALTVPEGGKDYDYGDTYPHEALYDRLHGVSFSKGCYVGQEIVSRMEHRATVKKRIVPVSGQTDLPADRPDIMMGDVPIGKLGSVSHSHGPALIRIDRAAEATAKNVSLTAGNVHLSVTIPDWTAEQHPAHGTAGAP